ncbi:MAG: PepSY-like domain-containing protein [Williamsia sp.]|nr:PepSY-like domain-containing protein [Williamsia sp.]
MKKIATSLLFFSTLFLVTAYGQDIKADKVPAPVKSALVKKYPEAKGVSWEKEDGNYEANWGGKSGEDNSVQFTPSGDFIEIVHAITVNQLPPAALTYIKSNYKGAKIKEAGKVTDAKGKITYEAEVNKKELVFDENGNFVKK